MRRAGGLLLAALAVCGCGAEEASRRASLRAEAMGPSAPLPPADRLQPSAEELKDWRAGCSPGIAACLPPPLSLDTRITPPGGGAPFTVGSRLRELGAHTRDGITLLDARGRLLCVGTPESPDGGERTIAFEDLGAPLTRFYAALLPPEQLAAWQADGAKVTLLLSSESPPALVPGEQEMNGLRPLSAPADPEPPEPQP